MNFPTSFRGGGGEVNVLQEERLTLLTGFPLVLHAEKACPQELFGMRRVVQMPRYAQFGTQSLVKALGGYQKESLTNV
jgi:hypothetical protein